MVFETDPFVKLNITFTVAVDNLPVYSRPSVAVGEVTLKENNQGAAFDLINSFCAQMIPLLVKYAP